MSELSRFVYIRSHVTLHVKSNAEKVNSSSSMLWQDFVKIAKFAIACISGHKCVEKPSATPQSSVRNPGRSTRDVTVQLPGTSKCPWSRALDDNPNRVPRFLTKAVCPNCKHYCRAVRYSHNGLVQKCDVRTGETV